MVISPSTQEDFVKRARQLIVLVVIAFGLGCGSGGGDGANEPDFDIATAYPDGFGNYQIGADLISFTTGPAIGQVIGLVQGPGFTDLIGVLCNVTSPTTATPVFAYFDFDGDPTTDDIAQLPLGPSANLIRFSGDGGTVTVDFALVAGGVSVPFALTGPLLSVTAALPPPP